MTTVSMKEAKNRFTELARLAEQGETIIVTRNGEPVIELVRHRKKGGLNLEAIAEYKRKHGIDKIVGYVSDDFDDPLPEDFLITLFPR